MHINNASSQMCRCWDSAYIAGAGEGAAAWWQVQQAADHVAFPVRLAILLPQALVYLQKSRICSEAYVMLVKHVIVGVRSTRQTVRDMVDWGAASPEVVAMHGICENQKRRMLTLVPSRSL